MCTSESLQSQIPPDRTSRGFHLSRMQAATDDSQRHSNSARYLVVVLPVAAEGAGLRVKIKSIIGRVLQRKCIKAIMTHWSITSSVLENLCKSRASHMMDDLIGANQCLCSSASGAVEVSIAKIWSYLPCLPGKHAPKLNLLPSLSFLEKTGAL